MMMENRAEWVKIRERPVVICVKLSYYYCLGKRSIQFAQFGQVETVILINIQSLV